MRSKDLHRKATQRQGLFRSLVNPIWMQYRASNGFWLPPMKSQHLVQCQSTSAAARLRTSTLFHCSFLTLGASAPARPHSTGCPGCLPMFIQHAGLSFLESLPFHVSYAIPLCPGPVSPLPFIRLAAVTALFNRKITGSSEAPKLSCLQL